LEGASWWNQAFESAGFINAFQVKILPEDADPMDLRFNDKLGCTAQREVGVLALPLLILELAKS
jgi:hypothetical protein